MCIGLELGRLVSSVARVRSMEVFGSEADHIAKCDDTLVLIFSFQDLPYGYRVDDAMSCLLPQVGVLDAVDELATVVHESPSRDSQWSWAFVQEVVVIIGGPCCTHGTPLTLGIAMGSNGHRARNYHVDWGDPFPQSTDMGLGSTVNAMAP